MRTFELSTPGYDFIDRLEEIEGEEGEEEMIYTENLLASEFNLTSEHFKFIEGFNDGKLMVKCIPCNIIITSIIPDTLRRHYRSKHHEKSMSVLGVDKRQQAFNILKELGHNDSSITFGKWNLWACRLCNETDPHRALGNKCYLLRKHFNSKHEITLSPKKSPSPDVHPLKLKISFSPKKREKKEEEEFDQFFDSFLNRIVDEEAKKKLKTDEPWVNELITKNCGFFDDLFQKTEVDKYVARSYARITKSEERVGK